MAKKTATKKSTTKPRVLAALYAMRILASIILFVLFPQSVIAGGSYFAVNIIEIEHDKFKFFFVAKLLEEFDYDDSGCKQIKISGYYDSSMWQKYSRFINEQEHAKSLKLLETANSENKRINLGYIGQGFFKTDECKYMSKGLFNDENGVYSVYASI